MSKLYFITLITFCCFQVCCSAQKTRVEKKTVNYYSNKDLKKADSSVIGFLSYDEKGNLFKVEETKYLQGKKMNQYLGYFKGEEKLLTMYSNGKLISKMDYDSLGTVIKEFGLINNEQDSVVIDYSPTYKNGKLHKRKITTKIKNQKMISMEEYTYQEYADSLIVTSVEKNDMLTNTMKKCFNKNKKLLYLERRMKTVYGQNSLYLKRYYLDKTEKVIEIVEVSDNQALSTEKIEYSGEKRIKSQKTTPKITIITTYE